MLQAPVPWSTVRFSVEYFTLLSPPISRPSHFFPRTNTQAYNLTPLCFFTYTNARISSRPSPVFTSDFASLYFEVSIPFPTIGSSNLFALLLPITKRDSNLQQSSQHTLSRYRTNQISFRRVSVLSAYKEHNMPASETFDDLTVTNLHLYNGPRPVISTSPSPPPLPPRHFCRQPGVWSPAVNRPGSGLSPGYIPARHG